MLRSAIVRRTLAILLAVLALGCSRDAWLSVPPATAGSEARVPDADPGPAPDRRAQDGDFIEQAPGVLLRGLTRGEKSTVYAILNTERSACDQPHSLAQSLRDDPGCHDSTAISQFVADAVRAGASAADIRHDIPIVLAKLEPKSIDLDGRPVYGPEQAPVTVVVFADFECPHCRMEAGHLREVIDGSQGKARLVFKHFPLGHHEVAKRAAVAAEIAHHEGKFWAMHDLIFDNQLDLTEPLIADLAQQAGLDPGRFAAAYAADAGLKAVEADIAEGKALGIAATPTVYVNGREVNRVLFGGTVEGFIEDALSRQ